MVFSSYGFVLLFLPATLAVFFLAGRYFGRQVSIAVLVGASLFFYGWWKPEYTWIIVLSILFNYAVGGAIGDSPRRSRRSKALLALGVGGNLGVLFYFKYAGFVVTTLGQLAGWTLDVAHVVLPLAISFFTFQQITYLVDAYRGEAREGNFLSYCLFVTFFPQLIAGPIVHHKEMIPQFQRSEVFRPALRNLAIGATIFTIGLCKKVLIADPFGEITNEFFNRPLGSPTFLESWHAALAYTMQIYFDFSGYSDMAIGLARMVGIKLPVNFFSPYRATSIIDFWRRWHMTLSRFLRDYLYIPLGGNRKGRPRRMVNLMVTMVLGGLWHGAGWTFVIWGALHGVYLMCNHGWRLFFPAERRTSTRLGRSVARVVTFFFIVVAWVIFRANSIGDAVATLKGMAMLNGVVLPPSTKVLLGGFGSTLEGLGVVFAYPGQVHITGVLMILGALVFVWMLPNTCQLMRAYRPVLESSRVLALERVPLQGLLWRPSPRWSVGLGVGFAAALIFLGNPVDFLYFNF